MPDMDDRALKDTVNPNISFEQRLKIEMFTYIICWAVVLYH